MSRFRYPRAVAIAVAVMVMAIVAFFAMRPTHIAQAGTTIELNSPLQQEGMSPDAALALDAIQDEAGISAWFNAGAAVNLALITPEFRTIEVQTANYIIGSVAVPDYPERFDVHVYAHKDGWFMAYYLASNPAAKVFDSMAFNGSTVTTTFERVLSLLANEAGIPFSPLSYWDFRFPNSNRFMLVAEDELNGDNFTVTIPQNFVVYERTWAIRPKTSGCSNEFFRMNGAYLWNDSIGYCTHGINGVEGVISAGEMPLGESHEFQISEVGVLALIYRAQ